MIYSYQGYAGEKHIAIKLQDDVAGFIAKSANWNFDEKNNTVFHIPAIRLYALVDTKSGEILNQHKEI